MRRARRAGAVALAVALLLSACSSPAPTAPTDKPTFGGGSGAAGDDTDTAELAAAADDAGIRPCPAPAEAAASGDGALPDIALECFDGGTLDLSRLEGPAVVNVWASWCRPCREELPLLARLDDELGDQVSVIGVDMQDSDPLAAVELAADSGVTYPQLSDPGSSVRGPLRVGGVPWTVFVDAQGRMVATRPTPFTSYEQLTDAVRTHLEVQP